MKDIFCQIIDGDVPSSKVYEDDDVLAILDISQTTKGHALVMPKRHYDDYLSCPQETLHKVMDVAQRIGQAEMVVLGAQGINILTNVGQVAGQSVMHFHVHVVPRYIQGDPGFQITMKGQDVPMIEMQTLAEKIKEEVGE